jgi:hypothetical protein
MHHKENSCLALQQVRKMSRKCHILRALSRYNSSIMKYDSPEHQVAKREIQDRTNWSYFWAAASGLSAITTTVLMLTPTIGAAGLIGIVASTMAAIGAGVQSYAHDREASAFRDKLEIELAKGAEPDAKQLNGAIKELSHEIHAMREQEHEAPMRDDGLLWTQFIEQQRAAPQPQLAPTPNPSA